MHIYKSPHRDIPIPDISVTELVMKGLELRGSAAVMIDSSDGRVVPGDELADMILRLAGGLTEAGYGAGAVVAVLLPNMPEYAAVFHAVAWAGGTVTPINPTYTPEEIAFQLKDAGADLLVTVGPLLENARAAAEGTGVRELVVVGGADGVRSLNDLMGEPMVAQAPVDLARHVLVMPYSSGTTGLPKGVMLSHRNLVANMLQVESIARITPGSTTLAFLPYFHIYGLTVLLNLYMYLGGVQVTMARFDLEAALGLIERHRMERLFVVPPVVLALAKHPLVDKFNLSSVKVVFSGAAPLGGDLAEACSARLGCETMQGYGMTEMSPVSHATPDGRNRAGSSGPTVPGTECRVVDPATLQDVEPGGRGELWVRGPQVMLGYLNRPEATAEALVDGEWLRTGDVAEFDADGYASIVDRTKELIKVRGFPVAPAELEALLVTHPGVADVAVIGVPDEEAGEVPKAFVTPADADQPPSLEDLQAFLESHVAHFKQIRALEMVESVPKSPSGKILRRLLRGAA